MNEKSKNPIVNEISSLLRENAEQTKQIEDLFGNQWGMLIESLVKNKLAQILQERGIKITGTSQRVEASYTTEDGELKQTDFDILASNRVQMVAIEAKSTFKKSDINKFLKTLKDFKKYKPEYKSNTVYGAVVYLRCAPKNMVHAEEQGLFLIRATGDSASIMNKKDFKPTVFS